MDNVEADSRRRFRPGLALSEPQSIDFVLSVGKALYVSVFLKSKLKTVDTFILNN